MGSRGENDETDDDGVSSSSDDSQHDVCETIEFYVGLLMSLIPSLERLYTQSSIPKQNYGQVSGLPMTFQSQVLLSDRSKSSRRESVKDMSEDQKTSDTSKADSIATKKSVRSGITKTRAGILREQFEKRLWSKTLKPAGRLSCPSTAHTFF